MRVTVIVSIYRKGKLTRTFHNLDLESAKIFAKVCKDEGLEVKLFEVKQ